MQDWRKKRIEITGELKLVIDRILARKAGMTIRTSRLIVMDKQAARFRDVQEFRLVNEGRAPAVIYQVRQKSTGRAYVGQTTQPFTLRWWQHLSNPTSCTFHSALGGSDITDWEFSVIEVIAYPADCTNRAAYITQRESHWIEALAAVEAGFNTVRPAGTADQDQMPLHLADPA